MLLAWCLKKFLHEWSLVKNLFCWLTTQTTFKIFPKQQCLDCYIKRWKCSSFIETCRVFRERRKRVSQHFSATIMNGGNRDVCLAECTWYCEDLAFCLFNISELKDSIFHDTELIFVYYIVIFVRALDFFC